jgi:RNA-directed DNA polymerase
MSLEGDRRQKSAQAELPLRAQGEAQCRERSGESPTAARGDERSGTDHLMERVVERNNAKSALQRVKRNKGSPGVDGMTVEELPEYLVKHWLAIREQLLAGTYQPQPVKRQTIPKSSGGERELGIPCVLDRMIQQAILQVLQPIFDPTFSEHSYGFRPGRSAHDAVRAAQRYVQSRKNVVVDVDLEKFFDRVNHDVLMGKLAQRIGDKRLLRLIRRYLEAGVMVSGVVIERYEGTPQGGPLSPLLANVLLDEVDKELEKRGHAFARYADDCNVYVRSKRAGERVMQTLRRLYARLQLRVNESKSAVASVWRRDFLGFSFYVTRKKGLQRRVATKALVAMKDRVRDITARNGGRSMRSVVEELRKYLLGWKQYFGRADTKAVFANLDKWVRHRVRLVQLKQWRHRRKVFDELRARGVKALDARRAAAHAERWWHISEHSAVQIALPDEALRRAGVPTLGG